MITFWVIFVFALGLIVGSFLNVLVVRYQTGLKLTGRSFCFSCGHKLSWLDLVPMFSFFFQKGRCRYCGARISWRYPLVELITGVVFVLIFLKLIPSFSAFSFLYSLFYILVFSILIAIMFYDARHKIIPDALVYFFIALSFMGVFIIHNSEPVPSNVEVFIIHNIFAGPVLALPFAALWFFSKGKWIGFGDAKLALGVGWLLGLSSGVAAVIIAIWAGAVAGIALLALKRCVAFAPRLSRRLKRFTIKSEIPFAPFLIAGIVLAFFYDISFSDIQSLFMF